MNRVNPLAFLSPRAVTRPAPVPCGIGLMRARWLPGRTLVMVADSSFAALELLGALTAHMTCITRLRLDAQLYAPAPARTCGMRGRPRKKGARLPALSAVLVDRKTRWQRLVVPRWWRCLRR